MLNHSSCVWLFVTLWTIPASFLCPWDSPGKNTGVGCHALLQGIFPTQGLSPHSLLSPALASGFFFFFFLPLVPPGPWLALKDAPSDSLPCFFFRSSKRLLAFSWISIKLSRTQCWCWSCVHTLKSFSISSITFVCFDIIVDIISTADFICSWSCPVL